ncbi:hypothetical protein NC651_011987 [Populus alba x Populus x berolinensis]|nr:hypothetical protein NC651_011987 [Populus alba x Populus x berolinensis]
MDGKYRHLPFTRFQSILETLGGQGNEGKISHDVSQTNLVISFGLFSVLDGLQFRQSTTRIPVKFGRSSCIMDGLCPKFHTHDSPLFFFVREGVSDAIIYEWRKCMGFLLDVRCNESLGVCYS